MIATSPWNFPVFVSRPTATSGVSVAWTASGDMWQDAARRRQLESIRKLRDGWDGADAASVSTETLVHCEALLTQLSSHGLEPDFITPTAAGTVDFEWERFLGRANLEIGDGNFGFYTAPRVGHPIMAGGPIEDMDAEEINRALETIASGSVP